MSRTEVDEAIRVMAAEAPVARRRLEGAEGIERGERVLHNERFENLPGGEAQIWTNAREARQPHWHTINDAGARVLCTPDDVPARVQRTIPQPKRGRSR